MKLVGGMLFRISSVWILKYCLQLLEDLWIDSGWSLSCFGSSQHHIAENSEYHPKEETKKYCHSSCKTRHCGDVISSQSSWSCSWIQIILSGVGAWCEANSASIFVKLCIVASQERTTKSYSRAAMSIHAHLAFLCGTYLDQVIFWHPLGPVIVSIVTFQHDQNSWH